VDQGPRYAIYFIPAAESDLYRFGSAILGYDCYTGKSVPYPDEFQADAAGWSQVIDEPRRYGFHATLKAPFRLLPSCNEAQLVSAVHSFAGLGHAVPMISPIVQMVSGFAAIVARRQEPSIDALASHCTTIFDAFRAPMSPPERARRMALGLSRRQIQNLDRWGYPHVFADFRFHMTLTGTIETRRRRRILASLRQCLGRMRADQPVSIDRLALVKQESAQAGYRVITHATLYSVR